MEITDVLEVPTTVVGIVMRTLLPGNIVRIHCDFNQTQIDTNSEYAKNTYLLFEDPAIPLESFEPSAKGSPNF